MLLWRGMLLLLRCGVLLRRSLMSPAQRPGGNHVLRAPPVGLGIRAFVGPRGIYMLRLIAGRGRVLLACGNALLGGRGMPNPSRTSVIGNVPVVGDSIPLHHCPIIVGGVDDALVHAHDRGVIGKGVAAPLAS